MNAFKQRSSHRHHYGAANLVAQATGIHYSSRFPCCCNTPNLYLIVSNRDFRTRGNVAALFDSASNAEATRWRALLTAPAELLCSRFKYGTQARIADVLQTKFQRIHTHCLCQFIHERFACEVVGRGRQPTIRALPKWRICGMKLDALVGNGIGRGDCGWPGIVVIKFPGEDRAVSAHAAFDVNHARRTEVRPREFFVPRPHQLYWLACSLCQTGSLDSRLPGVLAAIGRSGIRYDDPHLTGWNVKCLCQFGLHCKRSLRPCPHCEVVAFL